MILFAELKIEMDEDGNIILIQPHLCQEDQLIWFPPHQAEAICAAILEVSKSPKR